ncbi:MAG: type IVB secretion system protein IcmH/DotU [Pseudomonadota bacterium]
MSNDPFDPFGQNNRTIVRPNPGGRAPAQPGQPAAPPDPFGAPQQPVAPPPQQGFGVAPPPPAYQPPPQQAREAAMAGPVVTPGTNPLVIAAGPILDLLGRLRNALTRASFTDLKASVSRAIESYDHAASVAGARPQDIAGAKYALCTMADDIVMNLPGEPHEKAIWASDPMLPKYCGNERNGGVGFFQRLQQLLTNPGDCYDLLELKYVCLSLGFEGMHRAETPNTGQNHLQNTRREVYNALRRVEGSGNWDLSPNWHGMEIGRRSIGMQIPFWAVAAVAALLLTGVFFGLRFLLSSDTEQLVYRSVDIHPDGKIEIARTTFTPPPPPPPPPQDTGQLDRIRDALAPEIQQGLVTAEYLDANFIIVRMSNKLLFPSGKAEVSDEFRDTFAKRMGDVFTQETILLRQRGFQHGRVVALGHSDAQPLRSTSRWKSNQELSKARAQSVMDAIASHSPADLRSIVEGRGPDDPICVPAENRDCWPENRRVELLIERTL